MAESEGSDVAVATCSKEGEPVTSTAHVEGSGATPAVMEGAESEQEDEEDVFEVESIMDSKIEGGEVLYRVRWKGYDSDGDTWEPEAHLDDCKEVLLEFRHKQAESKQKAAKELPPKLSLSDIFDAESDSDSQADEKDESPQKKKKKSREDEDEQQQEDLKKKKSKSGKSKEKTKPDVEQPQSQSSETKSKKRLSESKEDLSSKKPKKDDSKEAKKSKKEEAKDPKETERKHKKSDSEPSSVGGSPPQEPEPENVPVSREPSEERDQLEKEDDTRSLDTVPDPPDEPSLGGPMDEEIDELKVKKKKKKHKKKTETLKAMVVEEPYLDKKNLLRKQRHIERLKELAGADKVPTPIPKNSRPGSDDKPRRSLDSLIEVKETKKLELAMDRPRKKHDPNKELKKEPKVIKQLKEQKAVYDAFTVSAEDRVECMEGPKKRTETSLGYRLPEDYKMKELKPVFKERRSTQDETDAWTFGASEGDQEVMDTVCRSQENSGPVDKSQLVGVAMDLQLEWMTLEDFQRHLDGSDEIIPKDPISNSALKEAVKNGDYLTVKYALNSKEEYNLDQEDSSGMTLTMMSAAAGQDDLLRLLIRKGAKINARQKNGTTALIHAAEKNYLSTVVLLLEAGAFVNLQQATGETAMMKACKRGNYDVVRLLIEYGADCNVVSKHQGNAIQFAKQSNNLELLEFINGHLEKLSRVVEDAIKDYFDNRLVLLEPIFPIACHRLCEGPDYSLDFNYKPPYNVAEDSGILLFIFHANFFGKEVVVRLCGPCSVQAVVLNDKFQLPVFLDAHFIYSFSPVAGPNKLFIRLSEVPNAKVKLLICAYRVQLH